MIRCTSKVMHPCIYPCLHPLAYASIEGYPSADPFIHACINGAINDSLNESINRSVNQSIHQSINQQHQSITQSGCLYCLRCRSCSIDFINVNLISLRMGSYNVYDLRKCIHIYIFEDHTHVWPVSVMRATDGSVVYCPRRGPCCEPSFAEHGFRTARGCCPLAAAGHCHSTSIRRARCS